MNLLALDLFPHIPGWLAHVAESLAPNVFDETYGSVQVGQLEAILYGWFFVIPLLILVTFLGTRNLKRVPSGLQNILEFLVETFDGFSKSMIGEKYYLFFANYVGTMFIYIWINNAWGLLPGMAAATSIASTTLALALCTFVVTHYAGIRFSGLKPYLMHYVGEPLWLGPLMAPIHIIGELARPLSLTLRLMGNIGGEEKAFAIFISLGLATGLMIPLQTPLAALGLFTTFVQALIFCLLTTVYVAGMLPHDHDHGHGDHGHEHEHA